MELEAMYPGVPFSPPTVLSQPIGAADTTIYVQNASVLPDAPNIAVIGTHEAMETVKYGGKSGNMLTGVQRGEEGVARSWDAGTPIGRNWTNKDYAALVSNIVELKGAMPPEFELDGKKYRTSLKVDSAGGVILSYEEA